MKSSYDIVVVGGGPAGLDAARTAAEKGAKVLLVEKENEFGRKPCGGGLSSNGLRLSGLEPSERFVENVVEGFVVYAPDESKYVKAENVEIGEEPGYVLDKRSFVYHLALSAADAGVDVWIRSPAIKLVFNDGFVTGVVVKRDLKDVVTVEAKVVIDASGYASRLSRDVLPQGKDYILIPAVQYKMTDVKVDDRFLYFYVGNEVAPEGYAWIFPTGRKTANVGIGVMRPGAKEWLDRFIARHPDIFRGSKILKFESAAVPVGGLIPKLVYNGLMVVGDYAGQVIPLTGGGNHSSMAGGKMAAEVAVAAIGEGDVSASRLSEYEKLYVGGRWGKRIRDSLRAMKAISKLSDNELNRLAELLDGKDIVDLANGINVGRVAKKILSDPVLAAKLAIALLS